MAEQGQPVTDGTQQDPVVAQAREILVNEQPAVAPEVPPQPAPAPSQDEAATPEAPAAELQIEPGMKQGQTMTAPDGTEMMAIKVDGQMILEPVEAVAAGFSFQRHNTRRAQELARMQEGLVAREEALNTAPAKGPYDDIFDPEPEPEGDTADLRQVVSELREELNGFKQERKVEKNATARSTALDHLTKTVAGFDPQVIDAALSRMTEEKARGYESEKGFKLLHFELQEAAAVRATTPVLSGPVPRPDAAPFSEPGGGAIPVTGKVEDPGRPLNTVEEITAALTGPGGLPSLQIPQ